MTQALIMVPESFMKGLLEYETYLSTLPTPTSFSGARLVEIMGSFQSPFVEHFHNEIATIASFADLPNAPVPNSAEADDAALVFKTWGKKTVTSAGMFDVVPFFLMNLDGAYEEGLWANWPPMPKLVKWGLVNVAGSVYGSWWKFGSCDGSGKTRELYALRE
jgi:hypothetical protein